MSIPLSPVLRRVNGWLLAFHCPGCNRRHHIQDAPDPSGHGPVWGWNGNAENPTFTPSLLIRWPANPEATEEFKEWRTERVCHSFIAGGQIQFLGDCTHALKGQTVPIPEWPSSYGDGT